MKMFKAGDYFSGTEERVCLVVGTTTNELSVYGFLSDKIKESFPTGVIIGKGGSTIENIKQDTNASLTITPKSDMSERVMTITGEDEIRTKALEIVLEKILEDPHHDSVSSVNYSNDKIPSINPPSIINDIQSFHDRMYL
ncbi:unnamed protein product [Rotaria sp. Silwood2]|nr:unnamed protein product [Rotaria sp. Silwood2]